jgi:DNA-binding Xre family transcriptional regulator
MNLPNNRLGRRFYVRHNPDEHYPPPDHFMRFLNPDNPFDIWHRGHAKPHTIKNIALACKHYQEILPKYKIIHRRLQSERLKSLTLRRLISEHRTIRRKRMVTRSLLAAHIFNQMALSDTEWSIAALHRAEAALTDFLEAICHFIGCQIYDFDNDEFDNNE